MRAESITMHAATIRGNSLGAMDDRHPAAAFAVAIAVSTSGPVSIIVIATPVARDHIHGVPMTLTSSAPNVARMATLSGAPGADRSSVSDSE